jgi:hypothetical protein
MKEWKHEEGNWEKYWKQHWDKKWGEKGQEQGAKYQEMGKIMNKLGETQFKVAKLVMQLATKKSDEEFKSETKDLEKRIKALSDDIDLKYKKMK